MKTTKIFVGVALAVSALSMQAAVKTEEFGKVSSGEMTHVYTLTSPEVTVKLCDYGARIVELDTLDKNGKKGNIALGFATGGEYDSANDPYFGPIVGRFGNRIKAGTFVLEGKTYHVPLNNGKNALHGGTVGFDRKMWKAVVVGPEAVKFTLVSPDGDMGFPGTLTTSVTYTLLGSKLTLSYATTTTAPTIVNLTNHTYWNLHGAGNGTVLDQEMQIFADRYTPVDETLIPTGELAPVAGTPFDFRTPKAIGKDIHADNQQLKFGGGGYDHNWVLNSEGPAMHKALLLKDPVSGRTMAFDTTEPGLQWYSGNGLQKTKASNGQMFPQYGAVVLETQHFPDSPNEPKWPTTELKPGKVLTSKTVFTFGVAK